MFKRIKVLLFIKRNIKYFKQKTITLRVNFQSGCHKIKPEEV